MKMKNKIVMALAVLASTAFGQAAKADQNQDVTSDVQACMDTPEAQSAQSRDDLASIIAACLTSSGRELINKAEQPNKMVACPECSGGSCS